MCRRPCSQASPQRQAAQRRSRRGRLRRGRLRRGRQLSALFPSPAPAPMLSSVAGGVRRSERRAPMLRRCRWGPKDRKAGTNAPSVADETRRSEDRQGTAPSGRVLAGKCPCRSVLRRKHLCESVTETSFAGSPLAGASFAGSPLAGASFAGSARAGGFSRERPCGRVPAKAPRKVPRKAPRVCPGSYCFGFGCAGRWLSSSSAASSAR